MPWGWVAAPPRLRRRGYSAEARAASSAGLRGGWDVDRPRTGRGDAAAGTWIVRGRGRDSVRRWGDPTTLYSTMIAFRLIIGFGLGGVYPLSATRAAEADGGAAAERR